MALTAEIKKPGAKKLGDTTKPFYAIIGLNDLFLEQSKIAAEHAQARFDVYRDAVVANIATARKDLDKAFAGSRERAAELQKNWTSFDAGNLQANFQQYINSAVRSYGSLAERGERLVTELTGSFGENPIVKRFAELGQDVAKQVEEAAEKAEARVREIVGAVSAKTVETVESVEKATEAVVEKAAKVVAEQETIDVAPAKKAPVRKTAARKPATRKPAAKPAAAKAAKTTTAKTTAAKTTKPAAAKAVKVEAAPKAAEATVVETAAAPAVVETKTVDANPATEQGTAAQS